MAEDRPNDENKTRDDSKEPIRLNLGCGFDIRPGFINIDLRQTGKDVIITDARKLETFSNNFANFIVAQHLIEYISLQDITISFHRWREILKPHGILEIRVLDILAVASQLATGSLLQEMAIALLYGPKDSLPKLSGYTSEFLQGILIGTGFTITSVVKENFDLIVTAIKIN